MEGGEGGGREGEVGKRRGRSKQEEGSSRAKSLVEGGLDKAKLYEVSSRRVGRTLDTGKQTRAIDEFPA